jgi:magnesium chelatase subunit H
MAAVLAAKLSANSEDWAAFQAKVRPLKLQRTRIEREIAELTDALQQAAQRAAARTEAAARRAQAAVGVTESPSALQGVRPVRMVLVSGFESFNVDLYRQVAARIQSVAPHIELKVRSFDYLCFDCFNNCA